jgi:hypothetical protein
VLSFIGTVDFEMHRAPIGKQKRCTIIRDVDQWYCCITAERNVVDVDDDTPKPQPTSQRQIKKLIIVIIIIMIQLLLASMLDPSIADSKPPRISSWIVPISERCC